MKVKHLKNKVVIETSKEDYNEFQYEMVDLLDLGWSSDKYKYVIQGD
jgi:hypothetical protein